MSRYHSSLTDADGIHEPKGVTGASSGEVYVATGNGSGVWSKVEQLGNAKADTFELNTSVDEIVRVGLLLGRPPSTGGATFGTVNTNGSGSLGVGAFLFASGATNSVYFTAELPNSIEASSIVSPRIMWLSTTANSGDVMWGLEYSMDVKGQQSNSTTVDTIISTAPSATKYLTEAKFSDITGSNVKAGTVLNCRLYRIGGDASDTYPDDAAALSMVFKYKKNKLGI